MGRGSVVGCVVGIVAFGKANGIADAWSSGFSLTWGNIKVWCLGRGRGWRCWQIRYLLLGVGEEGERSKPQVVTFGVYCCELQCALRGEDQDRAVEDNSMALGWRVVVLNVKHRLDGDCITVSEGGSL